jgi:hypothetical protein
MMPLIAYGHDMYMQNLVEGPIVVSYLEWIISYSTPSIYTLCHLQQHKFLFYRYICLQLWADF